MPMQELGILPEIQEPWGFRGVKREDRGVQADSRIFYVDPNNTQLGSDNNSGEDPIHPVLTIAQAVTLTRADKGDVIYVLQNDGWQFGSGTSNLITETVTIPATKPGIRLVGVGYAGLPVYWTPAASGETCLTISAIDVVVSGFGFTGDGNPADGIYVEWDGVTLFGENTVIESCFFDGDIETAIELEFSWYGQVYNNLFENCNTVGIMSDVGGSGTAFNRIYNNQFIDLPLAISLLGGADDNEVFRNRLYNGLAQAAAAAANVFINTTAGTRNMVHHNTMSSLLGAGNGAYDDTCSAGATDAWIHNYLLDGVTTGNPA